jgi:predicted hydrolase (HD superfamily)
MLEEKRFPAARLLHDPICDLAHLEIDGHGVLHADELSGCVELREEIAEGIYGHDE